MLSARMNKGSSLPYSLSEQEAKVLFRRHFPFVPLPYQLEAKLTSQVLIAVKEQSHYQFPRRLKAQLFAKVALLFQPVTLYSMMAITMLLLLVMLTTMFYTTYLR